MKNPQARKALQVSICATGVISIAATSAFPPAEVALGLLLAFGAAALWVIAARSPAVSGPPGSATQAPKGVRSVDSDENDEDNGSA